MIFQWTNNAIIFAVENVYKEIQPVKNFENKTNEFLKYCENLPTKFNTPGMNIEDWKKLLKEDFDGAYKQLKIETDYEIKAVWVLASFKFQKLLDSILYLLNKGDYYSSIVLIRTLTEVSCFSNYHLKKMKPLVDRMNDNYNNYDEYIKTHIELEPYFKLANRGTRIPVLLDHPDAGEAKSILYAIDFISQRKEYSSIRKDYDLLCDFVHPNVMSNKIFSVITNIYSKKKGKFFPDYKIQNISGEADEFYKDIPNEYQAVMLLTYFGMIIGVLIKNMNLMKETIEEFKEVEVKQVEKPLFYKIFERLDDKSKY